MLWDNLVMAASLFSDGDHLDILRRYLKDESVDLVDRSHRLAETLT